MSYTLTFIIFVVLAQVISCKSNFQFTRNISIKPHLLSYKTVNIHFECPNVNTKDDFVYFYKFDVQGKILLAKMNGSTFMLRIKQSMDLGAYECCVMSADKICRNATLNIKNVTRVENPTKFVYNISNIKYVLINSSSVTLDCEGKSGERVTWYRPAQFHIYTGNKLRMKKLTDFDSGSYYCARGSTTKEVVSVKKVILSPQITKDKEKSLNEEVEYFDEVIPQGREIRFTPGEVKYNSDVVTWEHPPGTIILNQARQFYLQSYNVNHTKSFFYYRINRNGDHLINKVGKMFISKQREGKISVEGLVSYGSKITLTCSLSLDSGRDTSIIWRRNNKVANQGRTFIIKKYDKDSHGIYDCESQSKEGLIRRFINLTPVNDLRSKIKMVKEARIFHFQKGKTKELFCKTLREDGHKNEAKDVTWTFQGKIIRLSRSEGKRGYEVINTKSASILLLINMTKDDEGTYKCFQGFSSLTIILLLERTDISLTLSPTIISVTDNGKEEVEFSCRIDTPGLTSDLIKWYFKPKDATKEQPLPKEVQVVQHASMSTSFINIENVLKKHEGIYICQIFHKKLTGKLIVKSLVSTVRPPQIALKPLQGLTFLCQWSGIGGLKEETRENKVFECNINKQFRDEIEIAKIERRQLLDLISHIKQAYKNMTKLIKEREKIIELQSQDFQDLLKEVGDNKKDIQKLKKEIHSIKEDNQRRRCEQPRNIKEWITQNKVCPNIKADFVWKIEERSKLKEKFIMSEFFYLNKYKLRLGIYTFKNGDISLGYTIMKGPNDDNVEWPMRLELILSFVDQVTFESFNALSLSYDTYQYKIAFMKPVNEMNGHGIGGYPFIKYAVLKDRPTVTYNDSLIISLVIA